MYSSQLVRGSEYAALQRCACVFLLEDLSADPDVQRLAREREEDQLFYEYELNVAREEARREGREQGKADGLRIAARRLLASE